jgi:hypothetical protein
MTTLLIVFILFGIIYAIDEHEVYKLRQENFELKERLKIRGNKKD